MAPSDHLSSADAGALFRFSQKQDDTTGRVYIAIDGLSNPSSGQVIRIPETIDGIAVVSLRLYRYAGVSIASVFIPKTVSVIQMLTGFPLVTDCIEIDPENPCYETDGCSIIRKETQSLVAMCAASKAEYVIPDGVRRIGYEAFKYLDIEAVHIPDSVEIVEGFAFRGCSRLTSITGCRGITNYQYNAFHDTPWYQNAQVISFGKILIRHKVTQAHVVVPEGIEIIGPKAFAADYSNMDVLKRVTLPSTLKVIGESAFANNTGLEELLLPEGLEVIAENAFRACQALTRVVIPGTVHTLGKMAFTECRALTEVVLDHAVAGAASESVWENTPEPGVISAGLFQNCVSLKTFHVPEGTRVIGVSAFRGCGLHSVSLPDCLETIGNTAFAECYLLEQIHLPANVTSLGDRAFPHSGSGRGGQTAMLQEITVAPENPCFSSVDGVLYSAGRKKLVFCPSLLNVTTFTIPGETQIIPSGAFEGNGIIRKLIIPASATEIEPRAFAGMTALKEVVFSGKREQLGKEWFLSCKNLNDITWPEGLSSIGVSCFQETGLQTVFIPDTVTSIEDYAFAQIAASEVTLPKTVNQIGLSIFAGVKDITVFDTIDSEAKPAQEYEDHNNGTANGAVGFIGIQQNRQYIHGACNAIWFEHTITVRSAQTGAAKYSIRMPANQKRKVYCTYASSWGKNASFHFAAVDELFKDLTADAKLDYALTRIRCREGLSAQMEDTLSRYVLRNATDLCTRLMEKDDVLTLSSLEEMGIVKKNTLEERLEQADKYKAVACKAWLLDWQEKNTSPKEKAKKLENSLKLRAPTVAEIKKIWPHKKGKDGSLIITGYNGRDVDVVVPDLIGKTPVTAIESACFSRHKDARQEEFLRTQLRSVVIPDSVATIGHMAFWYCKALEQIQLPRNLTRLSSGVFEGCEKLNLVLPAKLKQIDSTALLGIANETIVLPKSVKSVADDAFGSIVMAAPPPSRLTNITVQPGNKHFKDVDGVLFSSDGTVLIQYPKGRSDAAYTVPDGVTAIGVHAFSCCLNLRQVTVSSSVEVISDHAFLNCPALERVLLPKTMKKLGCAFQKCTALKEITVPSGVSTLCVNTFNRCSSLETVHLPETLVQIEDYAFRQCTHLKTVSIPTGLKGVGSFAFQSCVSLETLTFSESTTNLGHFVFAGCSKLVVHAPEGSKVYLGALKDKQKVSAI